MSQATEGNIKDTPEFRAALYAALAVKDAAHAAALADKDAALADKDAALAAHAAALADKDAALAEKDAALLAARTDNALAGQSHMKAGTGSLMRIEPTIPIVTLTSPTRGRGAESLLRDPFTGFLGSPISIAAPSSVAASFKGVFDACEKDPMLLMQEKQFYKLAVAHIPQFAELLGARQGARRMYGVAGLRSSRFTFIASSQPELNVRGRGHVAEAAATGVGGRKRRSTTVTLSPAASGVGTAPSVLGRAASAQYGPGYGGEIKSVDDTMIGQMLYYELMDLTGIYFPATLHAPGLRCFYAKPPVGYALLGFPHVAYYAAIELVGKVIVSPASQPFFLGSDEHATAAACLPFVSVGPPVYTLNLELAWTAWADNLPEPVAVPAASLAPPLATSGVCSALLRPPRSVAPRPLRAAAHVSPLQADERVKALATTSLEGSDKSGPRQAFTRASSARRVASVASSSFVPANPRSQSTSMALRPEQLAAPRAAVTPPRPSASSVCWAKEGAEFLKLVRGDARTAEQFRGMHLAYERLAEALKRSDRPSELGARTRLLYGQHEVLVMMDFAAGVECSDEEVTIYPGPIMRGAARAVAWLAQQGIVYTDLRGPNVLKSRANTGHSDIYSGTDTSAAAAAAAASAPVAVTLIDFDDCFVTLQAVSTLETYVAALREYCDVQLSWPQRPFSRTFAEEFTNAAFPELSAALDAAFKGMRAHVP
jgi:hypothetical protein